MTGLCKYKCGTVVSNPEMKNPLEEDGTVHNFNRCKSIKVDKGLPVPKPKFESKEYKQAFGSSDAKRDYQDFKKEFPDNDNKKILETLNDLVIEIKALSIIIKSQTDKNLGEEVGQKMTALAERCAELEKALQFETKQNLENQVKK